MSAVTNKPEVPTADSSAMIKLLGALSLVCGILIVATVESTVAPIAKNQEILTKEAVSELLPGVEKQVTYGLTPTGELSIVKGAESNLPRIFAGFDRSGKLLGLVIEASERGYADFIKAMYAYSPEKQAVVGFKIVEMKETPGLGDKISTDPSFQKNFQDLDATHPIAAVKHGTKKNRWEVDAITGATISSRAVGRMLEKSTKAMAPVIARNLERLRKGE